MDDFKWWLLAAIFPACSFAGLAALLRSHQPITARAIASATLNSGLFGVAVASAMIHYHGWESVHLTIGASILSGLGGNAALDFGIQLVKAYFGGDDRNTNEHHQK